MEKGDQAQFQRTAFFPEEDQNGGEFQRPRGQRSDPGAADSHFRKTEPSEDQDEVDSEIGDQADDCHIE